MAGFSDEDKERVREATDIVSLFSERATLVKSGRKFKCCCPFHDEKTPSCYVDPDGQFFNCFGCHEGGDVFTFVMKSQGVDFPDAVRILAERAGITLTEDGKPSMSSSQKQRLRDVCKESAAFFHTQLMRSKSSATKAARDYLSQRELGGNIPKLWNLGFAPGGSALVSHLRSLGFTQEEMVASNVATNYEGRGLRDRFYGRIMFPICDDVGQCIGFSGRVVGSGEPKYLNTNETPLFHKSNVLYGMHLAKDAMKTEGVAIVVEGYTDVIMLHRAGVANVVASMGTALTPAQVRMLSRHASRAIVYLFDGDEAGQRAADRALGFIDSSMTPEAGKKRIDILACTLPDGLDPADYVNTHGADALKKQIEGATQLIEYGIERRLSRHPLDTPEDRTAAFTEALAVLAPIKDSLLAKEYCVQIAARCRMRESDALSSLDNLRHAPARDYSRIDERSQADLRSVVHQAQEGNAVAGSKTPAKPAVQLSELEESRRRFEREFLGLCARTPKLGHDYAEALAQVNWHDGLNSRIADVMLDTLADTPDCSAAALISSVTQMVPGSSAVMVEVPSDMGSPEAYCAFLSEELTLGDEEDAIVEYKNRLKHPENMEPEELEALFETVTTLQTNVVTRRSKHRRPTL